MEVKNIKKDSLEERIEKAIEETREELEDLTEPTCYIYSSVLAENLSKEHLFYEIVSTEDYDYSYKHQFTIIPKNDEELYLIDLMYDHFQSDKFYELLQKGYMLIRGEQCREYLDIVGNDPNNIKKY